jgi:uncharacterized protein YkwD
VVLTLHRKPVIWPSPVLWLAVCLWSGLFLVFPTLRSLAEGPIVEVAPLVAPEAPSVPAAVAPAAETAAAAPADVAPAPAQAPAAPAVVAPGPAPVAPMEQTLFRRINEVRGAHGLAAFQYNEQLAQAARVHVVDMQQHNSKNHQGSDGSYAYQRIERVGYQASLSAEAIGWNLQIEEMIEWWLNSPTHRKILLSSSHAQIGIGYVGDPAQRRGHWWVLNVANPK